MANEATIRTGLQITFAGQLNYNPQPVSFQANVSVPNGPTPGVLLVSTHGVSVNFSQLVQPGLCKLTNYDAENAVEYGVWDGALQTFHPLGMLLAGEVYVIRFSPDLQKDYGSSVGTSPTNTGSSFRLRALSAPVRVSVECFDT